MPDEIELMDVITRYDEVFGEIEYFIFRFKLNNSDYKGWMAGVSGYYVKNDKPSLFVGGCVHSLYQEWESKTAEEHLEDNFDAIEEKYDDYEDLNN